MLTRCPACRTTFRVTPEQLKARAGKVRCGKCQAVFNALDTLVEAPAGGPREAGDDDGVRVRLEPEIAEQSLAPAERTDSPEGTSEASPDALPESPSEAPFETLSETPLIEAATEAPTAPDGADEFREESPIGVDKAAISGEIADILLAPPRGPEPAEAPPLSPEAVRDSALAAGLVAARESTQVPGYNKWAEGAFTGAPTIAEPAARPLWPFVLAALLLVGALAGQAVHHFRAELAVASPGLRPALAAFCAVLGCDIPPPRHGDLVSIESSDLQIDAARGGLLALSATLKNRAPYAQSWPLLELTLTDVRDQAVLRRVLAPADYLPAPADPAAFPPNGEVGVRLWLEAKDVAAAGYRLYVFYP
ncbi:MAG: zinc-ribbon domain-containing protein [Rhodocyclaceae bacterium]|nr:zinc-ribbon domain-containing protein [Rhodocyclaceae bacterium]